jgi:hypothetical protein
MMRQLTALCVLLALPLAASANGFGLFRRPEPVPAYYYVPVQMERLYYLPSPPPPSYPLAVEVVPRYPVAPVLPGYPVAPVVPSYPVGPVLPPLPKQPGVGGPLAPTEVAPPSNDPLIPSGRPMPSADGRTLSAKPATTVFDLYTNGDARPAATPGRFVVRFWNLSSESLKITIDGQSLDVPGGQSRTVEAGGEFVWQVAGRAPEVSRVPAEARGVTVAIRR